MSRQGSEHSLYQYVRVGIQHCGDLVRMEAPEQGTGCPDLNYCLRGVEGWLELKYCRDPKIGFHLRPTQHRWLTRRVEAGGNCWILAEYETPEEHWFALINSRFTRELIESPRPAAWKALAERVWTDRIDFEELLEFLTGKRVAYISVEVSNDTGEEIQHGEAATVEGAGVRTGT